MKTNHGAVVNRRVKENYGAISQKMTPAEKEWANKFERMEYAIERGFTADAVALAQDLNPNVSNAAIARIKDDKNTKERCNPIKAESRQRNREAKNVSDRSNNSNNYDRLDWMLSGGMTIDDDGLECDIGITLNPEDALIDMLDAAKAKGVDLNTYMNDPKFWAQPTEAHRPEKISDTQVEMIRALRYIKTRAQVATQFGISIVMVSLIWNNKVRVLERT